MQVVKLMKEIFPELVDSEKRVIEVLEDEEMSFNRTLDKGLKEFNKVALGLGDCKWAQILYAVLEGCQSYDSATVPCSCRCSSPAALARLRVLCAKAPSNLRSRSWDNPPPPPP